MGNQSDGLVIRRQKETPYHPGFGGLVLIIGFLESTSTSTA